ncbi:MAG: hypothetical protein KKH83_01230 [Candidatus Margulisbacteria bacterium]|nr:hypothetical protein [Candidatus Margulisiibacteriota bacterium]
MKKLFALTLLFCALSCFCSARAAENDELLAKIKVIRENKIAGTFERVSPDTLKFEGYIDKDSYQKYRMYIDDDVTTFIINSPGGDTNSGVKMGLDMLTRNLNVVIEGVAASSAANYLFLAGARKTIKQGFVGFHGNSQALVADAGGFDGLKEDMRQQYKVTNEYFEKFKKEIEESIALEKEFYGRLDISQDLFDITQEPGKGMPVEEGQGFDFLLPSPDTMKCFGIKNVYGHQDVGFAEDLGIKVIYY